MVLPSSELTLFNYKTRDVIVLDKKILLKLQKESSEDQHDEVEITESSECAYLEIVISDYDKKDWVPRVKMHHVYLEQAVIDLMDVLCVSARKHYYTKNHFVKAITKDLELDRDVDQSMGSDYVIDTMWGRKSATFKMTALSNYEPNDYKIKEIKVKKA